MGAGHEAEQEEAVLRVRALQLQELARASRVMTGSLAERDLERVRRDVEEAIASIEGALGPWWAIADRLKGIAVTLEYALCMGGMNAPGVPPLYETQKKLAAWLDGVSGA